MKRARWLRAGVAVCLVAGCSMFQPRPPEPVTVTAPPPPPPSPPGQPLPELPLSQLDEQPTKMPPRRLYTLSVRNANIRDVLLAFGKQTDLSVVFGPDVDANVTVDLKRVTLEEALDALLTPIGLVYRKEGNVVRVSKPQLETRVFTVSYITTTRIGGSGLSAAAGGTTGATTGTTAVGGAPTVGGGGTGAGASSFISSSDRVDLWAELDTTLASFLSKDGKAVIGRTAGLIAVTDYPTNLRRVAQYIELVEGSVQRQVMIEAKIVEVTLSSDFSAGINWNLIPKDVGFGPLKQVHGTVAANTSGSTAAATASTVGSLIAQALAPASTVFQIGLAAKIGSQTLELLLRALETQGKVNILSSPKLSTLNNQKAVMKVATDDVFFTTTRTREPTTGIITETVTPQTVTEGIVLDVTPQVGADDTITLAIRPSISERVGQATSPQGGTVPIVAVRAADTVVRAKDGQTVIIGGLIQNRSERDTQGVPGLQDVPLFGSLFRQKAVTSKKTELVILLTPTVLIGRRHSELTPQELRLLQETGRTLPAR